jgi:NAD(P) transhydrogenase
MTEFYDLVVIGAGPAGEKGAAQAAYFGKRVCIIERAPKPGGAAINTGTVPSKTLRETALYFSGLRQRGLYGVDYNVKRDITIADFMFRERSVVESEWKLIDENIKRHEITQIQGTARFVDPRTIEVARAGETIRVISAPVFLIATGSQPQQPDNIAVDGTVIVDSDSLLTLDRIPRFDDRDRRRRDRLRIRVHLRRALGVRVTIVTNKRRLLAHVDPEVSEALRQQMTSRLGVSVHVDTEVSHIAVEHGRAVVKLGEDEISADCVLFCAGRNGATPGLGLEAVGVRTNARGYILVDDHYQTSVPGIYAAGDIVGFPALASTAMEQARVAMCHAFELRYKQAVASVIPYGVYTIPEIAMVGLNEDELRAKNIDYECGRASYRTNARGQIIGDLDGFVKLIFRPDNQQLLGLFDRRRRRERIDSTSRCRAFGSKARSTSSFKAFSIIRRSRTRSNTRRTTACRPSRNATRAARIFRQVRRTRPFRRKAVVITSAARDLAVNESLVQLPRKKRRHRVAHQDLVRALSIDQTRGENTNGARTVLRVVRTDQLIHRMSELDAAADELCHAARQRHRE